MSYADMFHHFHRNETEKLMIETVRQLIDEKGNLTVAARDLARNADLYRAGLTPFTAIQVMLALENECAIEFPEWMLNRKSMSSVDAILACLRDLQAQQREARPQAT
jgi:hypothetical protein